MTRHDRVRTLPLLTAVLALAAWAAGPAAAQTYPDRVIKFVAPTTPGPTADMVARTVAEAMSKVLKQSIVVENKPGAEQMVGLEYLAKSAPADGYTVGVIGIDGQALMPLVRKNLRFDPLKDLTLIAGLGEVRYLLASPATLAPANFKDLVQAARAAPGKYNYGSSTPQVRLYTLSLLQELNLDLVHVPFPSGAPFLTALAGGTIEWGLIAEGTAAPVRSRLHFHAITGTVRSAANPDVPTFAELGFPRVYGPAYALAVRTGTPKAVIDKLTAAAAVALASPELRAAAQKILFEARYEHPDAINRASAERYAFYRELTKRAGIEPE
jgi:tripartite-type tricarboxylate transporter receptor subunit TctC